MNQTRPEYVGIDQFVPSRHAPIFRRFVRKYNCRENLALTGNFKQNVGTFDPRSFSTLSFKINNQSPAHVAANVRLCMPLVMQLKHSANDFDDAFENLQMQADTTRAFSSIAVQSEPLNAFQSVECYVNGKRYSKHMSEYGKCLEMCYASKDESAFRDNNSLKTIVHRDPYAQSGGDMIATQIQTLRGPLTSYRYSAPQVHTAQSNLLRQNTGFVERCRLFQEGLVDDGTYWSDTVYAKLNVGPFESRDKGYENIQIPYLQDLDLVFTFDQRTSQLDIDFNSDKSNGEQMLRSAFVSGLFQFGTPINQNVRSLRRVDTLTNTTGVQRRVETYLAHSKFPSGIEMMWLRKPYIEIEWIEFSQMSPQYMLHAAEYELRKSNQFSLIPERPDRLEFEDGKQAYVNLNARITEVPTKMYVWAQPLDTQKKSFMYGGVERFCKLENIRIRVNQQTDLIHNPSELQLFNWFKSNTNNALTFATWKKSPVYVFSTKEIAHPEFLANTAGIMAINIDCEVKQTPLIMDENAATFSSVLNKVGYQYFSSDKKQDWAADRTLVGPYPFQTLESGSDRHFMPIADGLPDPAGLEPIPYFDPADVIKYAGLWLKNCQPIHIAAAANRQWFLSSFADRASVFDPAQGAGDPLIPPHDPQRVDWRRLPIECDENFNKYFQENDAGSPFCMSPMLAPLAIPGGLGAAARVPEIANWRVNNAAAVYEFHGTQTNETIIKFYNHVWIQVDGVNGQAYAWFVPESKEFGFCKQTGGPFVPANQIFGNRVHPAAFDGTSKSMYSTLSHNFLVDFNQTRAGGGGGGNVFNHHIGSDKNFLFAAPLNLNNEQGATARPAHQGIPLTFAANTWVTHPMAVIDALGTVVAPGADDAHIPNNYWCVLSPDKWRQMNDFGNGIAVGAGQTTALGGLGYWPAALAGGAAGLDLRTEAFAAWPAHAAGGFGILGGVAHGNGYFPAGRARIQVRFNMAHQRIKGDQAVNIPAGTIWNRVKNAEVDMNANVMYQLRCLFEYDNETLVMNPMSGPPRQLTNQVASSKPPGIF